MQHLDFDHSVPALCLKKKPQKTGNNSTYAKIQKHTQKKNCYKSFQTSELEHGRSSVFCASCAIVCCCQTNQHLSLWLRTKPKCLVIVQSVIFLPDGLLDFLFLLLQMGLFLLFLLLFFFHLKEMPCTCQVCCMKVFTEPWGKIS